MQSIFLVCGMIVLTLGQAADPIDTKVALLAAELRVVPQETLSGLPVAIHVTLENSGSDKIWVPKSIGLYMSTLQETVVTPEGEEIRIRHSGFRCGNSWKPPGLVELEPGASKRLKQWISWSRGRAGDIFEKPGRYSVKVQVLYSPNGEDRKWLEIPPMVVQVFEPEGRNRKAADLFKNQASRFRHFPPSSFNPSNRHDREALERVTRLAWEHFDTDYGRYAAYLIASHESRAAGEAGRKKETASEEIHLLESIDQLSRLERAGPPENIREEILVELADRYSRLGLFREAQARLRELDGVDLPSRLSGTRRFLLRKISESLGQEAKVR